MHSTGCRGSDVLGINLQIRRLPIPKAGAGFLEIEALLGTVGSAGPFGKWSNRYGWRLARDFAGPAIGIPLFFYLAKRDDERLSIFALDVVPPVVEDIDYGVVLQPEHRARVERKPMLNRDFNTDLRNDGFGLLKSHNTRPLTLMSGVRGVNPDFTLVWCFPKSLSRCSPIRVPSLRGAVGTPRPTFTYGSGSAGLGVPRPTSG